MSAQPAPRFDQKFIEDHKLIERYLEGKLPLKGKQDLEAWCRSNPQYLETLNLSDRTHWALRLLEASGRAADLGEPTIPWWKSIYMQIGTGALALICLVAFWVLFGKYMLQESEISRLKRSVDQGTLLPPTSVRTLRLVPDRGPEVGSASVSLSAKGKAELLDLRVDMSFTHSTVFRMQFEKVDQGRFLVIDKLMKDSNGDLHLEFNSSGFSAGVYNVSIEGLPFNLIQDTKVDVLLIGLLRRQWKGCKDSDCEDPLTHDAGLRRLYKRQGSGDDLRRESAQSQDLFDRRVVPDA
jgi:hypothetical protein